MEFLCHYCRDWFDTNYCASHFSSAHGQDDVTIEKLERRRANFGGVETRDETQIVEPEESRSVFVTNNFRHTL